ncbi:MAG: hypothetical protein H6727_07385 [Myxococcales bacterium]|nr:hypothetical protein [Myxococcales bacterium]
MVLSWWVYLRVLVFAVASFLCAALMIVLIGSASRTFEERGYINANFHSVEGIYVGAYTTIAGMNVGIVEGIRLLRPEEQKHDLIQQQKRRALLRPLLLQEVRTLHLSTLQEEFKKVTDPDERAEKIDAALEGKLPKYLRKVRPPKGKGKEKRWLVPLYPRSLRVRTRVSWKFFRWLGKDSIATLKGKGMLGRAVIELSTSTLRGKVPGMELSRDAELEGESVAQVVGVIADINKVADDIRKTLSLINFFLKELGDPVLWRHLKGILDSVDQILAQARTGPGLIYEILYARRLARDARVLLNEVRLAIRSLADTGAEVSKVLEGVQQPETLVQRLLLSQDGQRLLVAAQDLLKVAVGVLANLRDLLRAPQRKGTFVNRFLFDPKAAIMLKNLRLASDDARDIIHKISDGRGAIGALLYDGTAYADLVIVLKNLKRSSLVRFFINLNTSEKEGRQGAGVGAQQEKE